MMFRKFVCAACVLAALSGGALAGDAQWTELTALPKGLNIGSGAALSILGIEAGATIDEVRAIAEALMKEHIVVPQKGTTPGSAMLKQRSGVDTTPPLEEFTAGVALTTPGGDRITLEYTGRIDADRDLAAGGQIRDHLRIDFSAPSSGHQVIGVQRRIEYNDDTKQPRIAPILEDLKARFGAEPMVLGGGGPSTTYRWQFDNGSAVHRSDPGDDDCWPYIGDVTQERDIDTINTRSGGDCDVVMQVRIVTGISDDHAKLLEFELSDNERGRANLTTDFGFFRDYVDKYLATAGGAAPAL